MQLDDLISRFQDARKDANGWIARCPAHDDSTASLSLHEEPDGRILIHCHAGCKTQDVLARVGLKMRDLFAEGSRPKAPARSSIVATYDYRNAQGELVYQAVRLEPKDFRLRRRVATASSARWDWSMNGTKRVLYRLPDVLAGISRGETIHVVEGEKDADSLAALGLIGTCNAGGAGKWLKQYSDSLRGANVVILPDNDFPGREHASKVASSLEGVAARIRIVELPDLPQKGDVSDWLAAGNTSEALVKLIESAPDYEPAPDPPARGADGELLNDMGNARRLVNTCGRDIRYCCDAGRWYIWDGARWAMDETSDIVRRAKSVVIEMYADAQARKTKAEEGKSIPAMAEAKRLEAHAIASGNHNRLMAMIAQAQSESAVSILANQLDADPWLLNTSTGTIDLRTCQVRPHRREDLISKLTPVAFDPAAACPRWEQFLLEVFDGDGELIEFVRHAAGYTLTGDTREQCLFILHGVGSNGKSTFVNVLRSLLGDYEIKTSADTITERSTNNTNDIAALRGARLVSAVETSAGKRLAEALVKELTGQDSITARFLYREFFTYSPAFKLWLACNHAPVIRGQDVGIWRRIRLIPFNVQFQDPGAPQGPYKDRDLADALAAELPGILNWALQGCLGWRAAGLPMAAAVRCATNQLQLDMDTLAGFLAERCYFDRRATATAKALYEAYSEWSDESGEKPLSQRWFGLRLGERGICEKAHSRTGDIWLGIGLRDSETGLYELEGPDPVNLVKDVKDIPNSFPCACARTHARAKELSKYPSQGSQGSHLSSNPSEDSPETPNFGGAF